MMQSSRRVVSTVSKFGGVRGMASLSLSAFGAPAKNMKYDAAPVAAVAPAQGQVAVSIKASPLTMEDVRRAHGQSLINTDLGQQGSIGVGVVSGVGAGETELKANDLVLVFGHTFADSVTVNASQVFKLPASLTAEQAATVPTLVAAYGILRRLPNLHASDVVFQTEGNTAVGKALEEVAKAEGIKVVSVANGDLLDATKLAALGKANHAVAGIANGKVIHQMTKALKDNGSIVVHHAAHQLTSAVTPVDLAVGGAIFHNFSVLGFNLHAWAKQEPASFRSAMNNVVKLVQDKKVAAPVATVFPLSDYAKAFTNTESTGALSVFKL